MCVVVVQDVEHVGVFLKWRCVDGAAVSVKVEYSLALIHRHDYSSSRHFTTTQRFTSSQALLGKTRFVIDSAISLAANFQRHTRSQNYTMTYHTPATHQIKADKKLRYREEHSASVVLSWCTL